MTVVAVAGPLFLTVIVYVIEPLAATGLGAAVCVMERSAVPAAATSTTAVAVLFARFGSFVPDVTEAVSMICVPLGTPETTFTTTVNAVLPPEPDGTSGFEQIMLPTVVHVQPAAPLPEATIDWNVVFAGIASLKTAFSASYGPLFATVCVYVIVPGERTIVGFAEFVTAKSAPAQYAPD